MKNPKLCLIIASVMFGSIGIFVRFLNFESEMISFSRGVLGCIFVFTFCLITKRKINMEAVKKNFILLLLSGAVLGINWVLLFEAYKHISVQTAITCYYLAPVIVTAVSPIFLKEKLTLRGVVCVLTALLGLVLTTGIRSSMAANLTLGVTYAVSAAILYASIVIMNKRMKNLSGIERTVFQLGISSIVMLPYVLIVDAFPKGGTDLTSVLLLLYVGIVLTGVIYLMYFSVIEKVKAQAIAIISYIDPITAIILSAIILHERMTPIQILGAVLILSATFINEVAFKDKKTEVSQ